MYEYFFLILNSIVTTLKFYTNIYSKDYNNINRAKLIDCLDGENNEEKLRKGLSCNFEYDDIYENTPCTELTEFGYSSNKPCVLLKLNKLIDFVPKNQNGTNSFEIICHGDVCSFLIFFLLDIYHDLTFRF